MKIRAALLAGALLLGCPGPGSASDLAILPIAGTFGLDRTSCTGAGQGRVTALVAPELCDQVGGAASPRWGAIFAAAVQRSFPGVVSNIQATGSNARQRLSHTLIASLDMTRADLWTVAKTPTVTEVTTPITLTLYLTDAATGEVLFADTRSVLPQTKMLAGHVDEEVRAQFGGQVDGAIAALVSDAAAKFKPRDVAGSVVGKAGGFWLVNAGRHAGLREGDQIGDDATVVFADADYAVVRPALGQLREGQSLSRAVAAPADALEKPSALVVMVDPDKLGLPVAYYAGIFEEALGTSGGLAVMPVNPGFATLRHRAIGDAQGAGGMDDARALPDYFVRVSVASMEPTDTASNQAFARLRTYEARAFVEVIDRAGHVIWATQAVDRIADPVVGVVVSTRQRQDTVVRNALVEAARQVSQGFHPVSSRLAIEGSGAAAHVADPGGVLGEGVQGTVLRPAGTVGGIREVMTPAGRYHVGAADGGRASLVSEEPVPAAPHAGDRFAYDGGSGAGARAALVQCAGDASNQGDVAEPLFGRIAANGFAGAFPGAVRIAGFKEEVRPLLSQFAHADELGVMHEASSPLCFQPSYRIVAASPRGSAPHYQLAMGFTIRRNGERVTGGGLSEDLSATPVSADADPRTRDAVLQRDLAGEAARLAPRAAAAIRITQRL